MPTLFPDTISYHSNRMTYKQKANQILISWKRHYFQQFFKKICTWSSKQKYLLTKNEVLTGKSKPDRDLKILAELLQGQCGKVKVWVFFRNDRTFEINKLFIIWTFCFVIASPHSTCGHYRRIIALELANHSMCYIGFKLKPLSW